MAEAGFAVTARIDDRWRGARAGLGDFRLIQMNARRRRADKTAEEIEQREVITVGFDGSHDEHCAQRR